MHGAIERLALMLNVAGPSHALERRFQNELTDNLRRCEKTGTMFWYAFLIPGSLFASLPIAGKKIWLMLSVSNGPFSAGFLPKNSIISDTNANSCKDMGR